MSLDLMSGAFYCQNLVLSKQRTISAFCKPVNIQIFSAPSPVKMRLVTYELHYVEGDIQPTTVQDWKSGTLYKSPFNNGKSFSFSVGTVPISLDEIFQNIRRHFYQIVLNGKETQDRQSSYKKLMHRNTSTPIGSLAGNLEVVLRDIHHVTVIELDDNWVHKLSKDILRYRGDVTVGYEEPSNPIVYKNKYIALPHVYKDSNDLSRTAVDNFSDDRIREKAIQYIDT